MIVGTAGHIDHGKSSLVRALTGTDPDRLKEEKRRGITIDLGYAYWPRPGGDIVGFVDVPGHEALIHNMLAGATGIDFVLLVVAADDGVMPQTREHLAILDLLGLRRGIVALTKADLADQDRRRDVSAEIQLPSGGNRLGWRGHHSGLRGDRGGTAASHRRSRPGARLVSCPQHPEPLPARHRQKLQSAGGGNRGDRHSGLGQRACRRPVAGLAIGA